MEIKINNDVYQFKEEITLDEFLNIGMPPMRVIEKMQKANENGQTYIPEGPDLQSLLVFQKRLMNTTCVVAPKNQKDFGKISLHVFNKIAADPKFADLIQKILSGEG